MILHHKSASLALNSFIIAKYVQAIMSAFPVDQASSYQPIMINALNANNHHAQFVLKVYVKSVMKAILSEIIGVINVVFLSLAAIYVINLPAKVVLTDIF